MGFKIIKDTLTPGLKKFFDIMGIKPGKSSGAHFKAMEKTGIQMFNWILNGSSKESRVPPIAIGMLRGSGSVFVENKCVHTSKSEYPVGDPNLSYDAGKDKIAIGFNTAYASRLHEKQWVPGGKRPSKQVKNNPNIIADVGNKYIEKHLIADKESAMKLYAMELKEAAGT